MMPGWLHGKTGVWVRVGVLVGCVALLYGHTLNVPMYLDDHRALLENYRLRDLPATLAGVFSQRGLANLSFALNYRLSGWSLPPLHLVNIALHVSCGLLAWRLLLRLFGPGLLPLLGALLFVAHPLQTQGVTYLVQRSTVMAAGLFLLAFLLYLRGRDQLAAGASWRSVAFLRPYSGALLAGALAVMTKENTAALALLLFGYERLFPLAGEGGRLPAAKRALPFLLAPLMLGTAVVFSLAGSDVERVFYYPLSSLQYNSPLNYLFTQFSVLWVYLRLLFLPYNQALEYGYPVVAELLTLQSTLALIGLLGLGWLLWRLRQHRPLLAFGGLWFFLALAVESSVIPLDPLFEHRLYLPLFGFVIVLLDGVPALVGERRALALLLAVLLICLPLTWKRNSLWGDQIAFYESNVRTFPRSERAIKRLAFLYEQSGRHGEALRLLENAVTKSPQSYFLYNDLAWRYAILGRLDEAFALLEQGMTAAPWHAALYEAAADICRREGDLHRAIGYLQRGLEAPGADRSRLLNDLGVYFSDAGASQQAEAAFLASLARAANPAARAATLLNLAREYYNREDWIKVKETLLEALALSPGHPLALERLVEMALILDDHALAQQVASKLRYVDPITWSRLQRAMGDADW